MSKNKIAKVDFEKVNQISVKRVAEDWGIELFPVNNQRSLAYCPNPAHNDQNLGNCNFVEKENQNYFYCFSCGAGGGPIDLIMLLEQCSFRKAMYKLAQKYGLIKYIDSNNLPPRWEGLSYEEYSSFGLKNVSVRIPSINKKGELSYSYKRYTLRELAHENPELHDTLLINKAIEKFYSLAIFMNYLDRGYFEKINYDRGWEDAIIKVAKNYKRLLEKGLMNKEKIHEVFLDREEMIEISLINEIRELFRNKLGQEA